MLMCGVQAGNMVTKQTKTKMTKTACYNVVVGNLKVLDAEPVVVTADSVHTQSKWAHNEIANYYLGYKTIVLPHGHKQQL